MKPRHLLLATTLILTGPTCLHAATITGADTVNHAGIFTTADGLVTLTPYSELSTPTVGSFNAGPAFIGVFGGTNNNAIVDADGDPATLDDRQAIDVGLSSTVWLTEIIFAWSRADGPAATDGIQISGFASDPGASGLLIPNVGGFRDIRWDAGSGSVFAELSGAEWNGTNRVLSFSNATASMGQTLRITVNDSDQAGPVASIRSLTYIPEPSVALLGSLSLLGLLRRRR